MAHAAGTALELLPGGAAAGEDDQWLHELGAAGNAEQGVLAAVEIVLQGAGPRRLMLQVIAQLADAVGELAGGVLHRQPEDPLLDAARGHRRHVAEDAEHQAVEHDVAAERCLRIGLREEDLLERLLRSAALARFRPLPPASARLRKTSTWRASSIIWAQR